MKIYIENQILEYENNKSEIDKVLNSIEIIMSKTSNIFSHMIIDDFEIYGDYYNYFLANIKKIQKVEVVSRTYGELVSDILSSTLDYIEKTPSLIEQLADNFYKNPDSRDWTDLNDLLGGISWIMSTFSSIDNDRRLKDIVVNYESWNLYAKEVITLQELLISFEEALSSNDNVSIADILAYEIVPIFNEMKERLLELANLDGLLN